MTLDSTRLRHAWFVQFNFSGSTVRVWNGFRNISIGGQTWQPVGAKGSIQQIDDLVSDTVPSVQMTVSGVPASLLAVALSESNQVRGRLANISDLYFDANWQPIGSLEPYTLVRMDTLKITRRLNNDKSSTRLITVTGEYYLTNGPCPPAGRYSSPDQWTRQGNTNDLYFEFMAINQNRRQRWPQY